MIASLLFRRSSLTLPSLISSSACTSNFNKHVGCRHRKNERSNRGEGETKTRQLIMKSVSVVYATLQMIGKHLLYVKIRSHTRPPNCVFCGF